MSAAAISSMRPARGWSDPAFRALATQAAVLLLLVGTVAFLATNLVGNLEARSIRTGFGFLWQAAGFEIGQSFIAYSPSASFARALLVGLLNTFVVASLGILLSTLAGFVVGIASLSRNPLVSPLARLYVELIRNTPLLLQLYLWYAVLTQMLPAASAAPQLLPGLYLAKSGLHFPVLRQGAGLLLPAAAVGILAWAAYGLWSRRRAERTGAPARLWPGLLLLVLPLLASALSLAGTAAIDLPQPTRFGFSGGGMITPELTALLIGLSLYNAAFVGEILRGGILSVGRGQLEAATALGLSRGRTLRLVVIPQAMRVAVPPLASQYLNLAKNTSLAIAIGYPDLMSIGNTIINQTGQAVEVIAILMSVYLAISLAISAFMNWYNARVALKGAS
ncbi:putative ABC transporter membrane subunit YhdX [Hyphomicrobiales bacterium]|nr:putative ABC transporter membrane subunit YhdX [Hyphomicrobiales bacterium]CAH1697823.1 putative ABC transporter membrane subunit YhdX [Hyphomicrobiales bacterium]CAI0347469.1 putative ABC transporter membrane subunit YhdX [Hyphomicrobiales bacterium]